MRSLLVLLLAWCCVAQVERGAHPEDWRLIRLSPEIEFWASPEQINSLAVDFVGFIDVTDTYDLEEIAARHPRVRQSYPTTPAHFDLVNRLFPSIEMDSYINNLRDFSAFKNRVASSSYGLEAAVWLEEQVQAVAGAVGRTSRFDNTQFAQFNIIHRIDGDGTDNNTVIIGAHLDSTSGFGGNEVTAPGADDDGSGSMLILELLDALVRAMEFGQFTPKRPIEFHWYAGEERGLVGSGNMARDYAARSVPVYSMFQFDMVGYPADLTVPIGVVTDFTDPSLTTFSRMLIRSYVKIQQRDAPCGYGCSDHASWYRSGYPAVFNFEAPFDSGNINPYIHTARDTIENGVDLARSQEFAHLGMAYLVEASLAA